MQVTMASSTSNAHVVVTVICIDADALIHPLIRYVGVWNVPWPVFDNQTLAWILIYTVHNKPLSYCSIADTSPD